MVDGFNADIQAERVNEKQAEIFRLELALAWAVECLGGRLTIEFDDPPPCLLFDGKATYTTMPVVRPFPLIRGGKDLGKGMSDPNDHTEPCGDWPPIVQNVESPGSHLEPAGPYKPPPMSH